MFSWKRLGLVKVRLGVYKAQFLGEAGYGLQKQGWPKPRVASPGVVRTVKHAHGQRPGSLRPGSQRAKPMKSSESFVLRTYMVGRMGLG